MNAADWMIARGSGMTAFLLLTITVVLGLLMSLRIASPRWPLVVTNDVHRFISSLALWTTGLHLVMLLIDSDAGVSLANLVVPLTSEYRPVATTLGVVALYAVLAVWATTAMRRTIGHRRWRQLHGLAFVGYLAALGHGLFAGSDSSFGWARALYAVSALLVVGLTVARLLASTPASPASAAAERTTSGLPSAARERELPRLQPRYRPDIAGGLPPLHAPPPPSQDVTVQRRGRKD